MFEDRRLDALSSALYRTMLDYPHDNISALAERHGTTEEVVRKALGKLSSLAMIQPSVERDCGFYALSPKMAMDMLTARQQADLAQVQVKFEAARAAASQLIADYSSNRQQPDDANFERIVGAEAIRDRLALLGEQAESEILTFAPGGAHPEADLLASRAPNAALMARGIRMRTIYLESVRNHLPTLEHINWLTTGGAEVRTTASLPTRLIVIDRRKAVLPIELSDARLGALLVWNEGTLAAVSALFESVWAGATPFGSPARSDPVGLHPQKAEVLRLLSKGLTDEAIAKRLGVSPRTARRIAAELMQQLGARSRFEAGVRAARLGWADHD